MVGSSYAIHRLLHAVAQTVIAVAVRVRPIRQSRQPVGFVIGIRIDSIIQQIAVVVPGVGHTPHAGQPVGGVVGVAGCHSVDGLAQAVPDCIIGVAFDLINC